MKTSPSEQHNKTQNGTSMIPLSSRTIVLHFDVQTPHEIHLSKAMIPDYLELFCTHHCDGVNDFHWYKDGEAIVEILAENLKLTSLDPGASSKYADLLPTLEYRKRIVSSCHSSFLRIATPLSESSGVYTCNAHHKTGISSASVTLLVDCECSAASEYGICPFQTEFESMNYEPVYRPTILGQSPSRPSGVFSEYVRNMSTENTFGSVLRNRANQLPLSQPCAHIDQGIFFSQSSSLSDLLTESHQDSVFPPTPVDSPTNLEPKAVPIVLEKPMSWFQRIFQRNRGSFNMPEQVTNNQVSVVETLVQSNKTAEPEQIVHPISDVRPIEIPISNPSIEPCTLKATGINGRLDDDSETKDVGSSDLIVDMMSEHTMDEPILDIKNVTLQQSYVQTSIIKTPTDPKPVSSSNFTKIETPHLLALQAQKLNSTTVSAKVHSFDFKAKYDDTAVVSNKNHSNAESMSTIAKAETVSDHSSPKKVIVQNNVDQQSLPVNSVTACRTPNVSTNKTDAKLSQPTPILSGDQQSIKGSFENTNLQKALPPVPVRRMSMTKHIPSKGTTVERSATLESKTCLSSMSNLLATPKSEPIESSSSTSDSNSQVKAGVHELNLECNSQIISHGNGTNLIVPVEGVKVCAQPNLTPPMTDVNYVNKLDIAGFLPQTAEIPSVFTKLIDSSSGQVNADKVAPLDSILTRYKRLNSIGDFQVGQKRSIVSNHNLAKSFDACEMSEAVSSAEIVEALSGLITTSSSYYLGEKETIIRKFSSSDLLKNGKDIISYSQLNSLQRDCPTSMNSGIETEINDLLSETDEHRINNVSEMGDIKKDDIDYFEAAMHIKNCVQGSVSSTPASGKEQVSNLQTVQSKSSTLTHHPCFINHPNSEKPSTTCLSQQKISHISSSSNFPDKQAEAKVLRPISHLNTNIALNTNQTNPNIASNTNQTKNNISLNTNQTNINISLNTNQTKKSLCDITSPKSKSSGSMMHTFFLSDCESNNESRLQSSDIDKIATENCVNTKLLHSNRSYSIVDEEQKKMMLRQFPPSLYSPPPVKLCRKRDIKAQREEDCLQTSPKYCDLKTSENLQVASLTNPKNGTFSDPKKSFVSEQIKRLQNVKETTFLSQTRKNGPIILNGSLSSPNNEFVSSINNQTNNCTALNTDKTRIKLPNANHEIINNTHNCKSEKKSFEQGSITHSQTSDEAQSMGQCPSLNRPTTIENIYDAISKKNDINMNIALKYTDTGSKNANPYSFSNKGFKQQHAIESEAWLPYLDSKETATHFNYSTETAAKNPGKSVKSSENKSIMAFINDQAFTKSSHSSTQKKHETVNEIILPNSYLPLNLSASEYRKDSIESIQNKIPTTMKKTGDSSTMKQNSKTNSFFPTTSPLVITPLNTCSELMPPPPDSLTKNGVTSIILKSNSLNTCQNFQNDPSKTLHNSPKSPGDKVHGNGIDLVWKQTFTSKNVGKELTSITPEDNSLTPCQNSQNLAPKQLSNGPKIPVYKAEGHKIDRGLKQTFTSMNVGKELTSITPEDNSLTPCQNSQNLAPKQLSNGPKIPVDKAEGHKIDRGLKQTFTSMNVGKELTSITPEDNSLTPCQNSQNLAPKQLSNGPKIPVDKAEGHKIDRGLEQTFTSMNVGKELTSITPEDNSLTPCQNSQNLAPKQLSNGPKIPVDKAEGHKIDRGLKQTFTSMNVGKELTSITPEDNSLKPCQNSQNLAPKQLSNGPKIPVDKAEGHKIDRGLEQTFTSMNVGKELTSITPEDNSLKPCQNSQNLAPKQLSNGPKIPVDKAEGHKIDRGLEQTFTSMNGNKRQHEFESSNGEDSPIGDLKTFPRKLVRNHHVNKRPTTMAPSLEIMPVLAIKAHPITVRTEDPRDYFTLYEVIGKGKFGRVLRCVEKKNGQVLAIKLIDSRRLVRHEDGDFMEVAILRAIGSHESIAGLHSAYEFKDECYIVTEYVSGGALFNRVVDEDNLDEQISASIIHQILLGLQHIQNCSVLHLDLKPENVMMVAPTGYSLKIIDFGLACFFDPKRPKKRIGGTFTYSAPETINYECQDYATDVWSVAVIAYELLSGITPFEIPQFGDLERELKMAEITTNIISCRFNFEDSGICDATDMAKDFIRSILKKNPKDRPTVSECLKHSWMLTSECLPTIRRKVSLRRRNTAIGKCRPSLDSIF